MDDKFKKAYIFELSLLIWAYYNNIKEINSIPINDKHAEILILKRN